MWEPDELLEMQYEEMQAPTLLDDDWYWINANEANEYLNEGDDYEEDYEEEWWSD